MATATAPAPATAPATATTMRSGAERSSVLLRNVSWEEYEAFLEWLGDRPGVKVNYDSGSMEIMAPQLRHDLEKSTTARFIERLCEITRTRKVSGGSVTLKRQLAEKGLEPDECYWIAHEPDLRHKQQLDLAIHPPPDLAIEIENTSTILNRLPIYAGIGVPEVWRWTGDRFYVLLLGPDGQYHRSEASLSFPTLPMPSLSQFVGRVYDVDDLTLIEEFVAWVRDGMPPLN